MQCKKALFSSLLFLFFLACRTVPEEIPELFPGFVKRANFPEPAYDQSRNQFTEEGFELGKRLFFEPRLSRNITISCGSCHIPPAAFTYHGHDVSHGID